MASGKHKPKNTGQKPASPQPPAQSDPAADEPRRPGRPPGSRNRDYVLGYAVNPRCCRCRSTNLSPCRTVHTLKHNGTAPDGQPYTQRRSTRCVCLDCDQANAITLYDYIPSESEVEESGYDPPPDGPPVVDGPGFDSDPDIEVAGDVDVLDDDEPGDDILDSILAEEDAET